MKILITGGTGMCGKNILEHPNISKYHILSPTSQELDLLNFNQTYNYLKKNRPSMIIHTAGLVAGIQFNIKNPVRAITDNTYIGLNLINASNQLEINRFLNFGSSCMYPRFGINPLKENQILKGELEPTNEGYAISKVLSTRLCEYINYENSNRLYKTLIPCNLFGRHDTYNKKFSHMIPAAIQKIHEAKILKKSSVEIWGNGETRREFMSASDLADLVFYCVENYEAMPQNLNAGLGIDYTINEYYKAVAEVIKYDGDFFHNLEKPEGMKQKLIDTELLHKFGWKNKLSLEDGIKIAYDFFINEYQEDKIMRKDILIK